MKFFIYIIQTHILIRVLLTTHIDPSGWGKQTCSKRRVRCIRSLHIRLRVKRKVLRPGLLECWVECLFSQIYKLNIFPSSLIFSFALQKLSCFRVFWKKNISDHKLSYKLCYFWLKHMFDVSFSSFHKISPFLNIFRLHFFKCSPLLTV